MGQNASQIHRKCIASLEINFIYKFSKEVIIQIKSYLQIGGMFYGSKYVGSVYTGRISKNKNPEFYK